jgi:hypothetical protein
MQGMLKALSLTIEKGISMNAILSSYGSSEKPEDTVSKAFAEGRPCLLELKRRGLQNTIVNGFQHFIRTRGCAGASEQNGPCRAGRLGPEAWEGCFQNGDLVFLHYRPTIEKKLSSGETVGCLGEHRLWLGNVHELYEKCSEAALEIGRSLGEFLGDERVYQGVRWSVDGGHNILRIIHYPAGTSSSILREGHDDDSLFSLHLGDNRRGLAFAGEDSCHWETLSISSLDEAIVFPGTHASALTDGRIRPLRHRVAEYQEPIDFDQWAIVFLVRVFDKPFEL